MKLRKDDEGSLELFVQGMLMKNVSLGVHEGRAALEVGGQPLAHISTNGDGGFFATKVKGKSLLRTQTFTREELAKRGYKIRIVPGDEVNEDHTVVAESGKGEGKRFYLFKQVEDNQYTLIDYIGRGH